MLHLIETFFPAALHRAVLRMGFRLRHQWRRFRKTPIIGCNVIVTDLKGNILMLRHSYGPAVWALPGGGVKRGEDPELAAQRELYEELAIKSTKLRPIREIHSQVSGSPHTTHLFALICDTYPKPDNREVIEARFFPPHSLPEPMGKITQLQLETWRQFKKNAR